MNDNRYIAPGVSRRAIREYYAGSVAEGEQIHTLQIWQGDRCLCRLAPAPYSCTDRREVYSLSKTFCSTAVGCAVDEGLLSVDDRIVDIFPDKLPAEVSENLSKMRVRHVLSMNTGHASCVMSHMFASDDAVRAFLAQPVPYEPGTHFAYNTGASCLLAAIIKKVTGEQLYDYLSRKILFPLGIRDVVWNLCAEGINEGGCGVQVTSDEIVKLARLYRNKGVWEGKRLISEEWINEATSFHSDNSTNGTIDWQAGYGYQIWLNAHGGYRGDGAQGQLMIIFPDKDILIAVQALVPNMQKELTRLEELAEHLFDGDDGVDAALPDYTPPMPAELSFSGEDAWYRAEPNVFGWTTLHLYRDGDVMTLDASDGRQMIRLSAGAGRYVHSEYISAWRKPKLLSLMGARMPEKLRTAAYYTVEDGVCTITSRHLCDPHTETITLRMDGDTLTVQFACGNYFVPEARSVIAKRVQ